MSARIDEIKERLAAAEYIHDCGFGHMVTSPRAEEERPEEVKGVHLVLEFEDPKQDALVQFLVHAKHDMEWLVREHARLSAWVNARVKADLDEAAEKAAWRRGELWEPLVTRVVTPDRFTPKEQVIAAGLDALRPPEPEPREPFALGDLRMGDLRMGDLVGPGEEEPTFNLYAELMEANEATRVVEKKR